MSARGAVVGCAITALVFLAIGRGCAPEERIVQVPGPTETVSTTVTETVTVKEPAKELPESCIKAAGEIAAFQSNVEIIDGSAGRIKLAVGNLQGKAAFGDTPGMTPIIEELNADVRALDEASAMVAEQSTSINNLAVQCSDDVSE